MDGRDAMSMPGAPYYLHRGIQQPVPHVKAAPPPMSGMMLMHNSAPNMAILPSGIGGSGSFQMESPPVVTSLADGSGGVVAVGGGVSSGGISQGEPVKRKRGRPRKYALDGNVPLALSPISSSAPGGSAPGSRAPGQKRGRGRPPGTGRKQQMASLGEWFSGSAGMGFTPHIITVAVGEDITMKIMSFSQQGGRTICILSANGAVNTVTLRKPETSGGTATYKGPFEIICLSGAYVLADNDGSRSRRGGLSVILCSSDGRIIAGSVGGLLEAATPVQVILGSFMPGGSKVKKKKKTSHESGGESDFQSPSTPSIAAFSSQTVITPSPVMGGWPDMRNAHLDIDLTRE